MAFTRGNRLTKPFVQSHVVFLRFRRKMFVQNEFVYLFVTVCPFAFGLLAVQRDVRQGTPTQTGAVPGQRGRVAAGRAVQRRTGETGGRPALPGGYAVSQAAAGGRRLPVEGVAHVVAVLDNVRPGRAEPVGELPALQGLVAARAAGGRRAVLVRGGTAARVPEAVRPTAGLRGRRRRGGRPGRRGFRFRLAAGRVARVFARVRQEGPADEARVLFQPGGVQEGEPQALRPEHPAAQEAQVQPEPVRRSRVVRGRSAEAAAASAAVVGGGCGGRRRVRAERARAQRVGVLPRHADRQTRRVPDPGQGQRELFRNLRAEVNY